MNIYILKDLKLNAAEKCDFSGCIVVPGFVDTHMHGCVGVDVCDGTRESLTKTAVHLIPQGVTYFCPTTRTIGHDEVVKAAIHNA